jgi:hypothetical protein
MGEISAQQTGALQQGYSQSLTAAQREQERQASLASQAQQLGLTGVGALQTAGGMQQAQTQRNLDLATQDFERQFAYPQEQIGALTKTLDAVAPAVPQGKLVQGYGAPGAQTDAVNSPLAQVGSTAAGIAAIVKDLESIGIKI